MGPWRHSGANYDGTTLGPLKFNGDTALQWRRDVLKPFFDQYLKDAPKADTPPAMIYNTGENHWDRFQQWPLACDQGCAAPLKPLYHGGQFRLCPSPRRPQVRTPMSPIPPSRCPICRGRCASPTRRAGRSWLTTDQRPFADRPDVLVYETDVLNAPVRISGAPVADSTPPPPAPTATGWSS